VKVKKGDTVVVVAGKDKGARGKVIAAYPRLDRVLVEGVNRVKKHTRIRTTQRGSKTGGIVTQEASIHVSNVMVVDPDGAKVLERTSTKYRPDFSWTARNAADRPLEPGAYTLRVRITDEAGNARTIRRDVVVSDAQLTERLWTVTIPAASADQGPGPVYDPSCLGCGEVCGPVPSDRFPGGLSFRQPCSFGYAAVEYFAAAPPDVPAPVDTYRVSATGGPTTPGDSDVAHLGGVVLGPGDTAVTTPWLDVDLDSYPYLPDAERPMRWAVSTSEQNDYDIASFTVEYRYYVPVAG